MFRVDAISTRTDPALGTMTVGDDRIRLSDFDLIVIVGPNGSGKSQLTECLRDPDKRLKVTGPAGETFDPKRDAHAGLLSATSTTLLGKFADLSDALAMCAGVSRLKEEIELLSKLVPDRRGAGDLRLDSLLPQRDVEQSGDLQTALERLAAAERHADATVNPQRRYDLSSYNAIGRTIAEHLGKQWTTVTPEGGSAAMRLRMEEAEGAVRVDVRSLKGDQEASGALQRGISWYEGISRDMTARDAAVTHQRALSEATEQARTLLARVEGGNASHDANSEPFDLIRRLEAACVQLENKRSELDSRIRALNALADVRSRAASYLKGCGDTQCPVCRTDVSREALIAQLLASDVSSDGYFETAAAELNEVKASLNEATDVAKRLSTAHESVEQATAGLNAWSARWSKALHDTADALQQRPDWDAAVRESLTHAAQLARSLRTRPEWSQPLPGSVQSIIDVARGLADACKDGETKLNRSRGELNRGVSEARELLPQLSALRDLVLAQITLNDIRWDANWQAHADDDVKCQVVARWQEAVKQMISERTARLRSLNDEILGDPGVVARFSRLLSDTRHPLLTAPKLGSHEVSDTAGGNSMPLTPAKSRDSRLSEGYTVMVNLAALVAITGYVRDGQRHRAGWLLLDEPTNGLDEDNRKLVARYLGSLTTADMQRQIVVTTFDTEFARLLIDSARGQGNRRTIKVELPAWTGRFSQKVDCVPQ